MPDEPLFGLPDRFQSIIRSCMDRQEFKSTRPRPMSVQLEPEPMRKILEHPMKETIIEGNLCREFYTAEKCYITELSNTPDDPEASIARARVEPGITTRRHRLRGTSERYYILSGKGIVEVGKLAPQEVYPGDIVLIPPMCPQRTPTPDPRTWSSWPSALPGS